MPFFEVFENCSYHLYNIGCYSMIYKLKYAKSESNFDSNFEHPTHGGRKMMQSEVGKGTRISIVIPQHS